MKHKYRSIAVIVVALALSGCAGGAISTGAPASSPVAGEESGSTIAFVDGLLTYEVTRVGDNFIALGAAYAGEVSFEDGCLLVGGAPFVFPRDGTSWDGTTLRLNGNEFVVGDQISVGGGGGLEGLKLPENATDQCGGEAPIFASTIDDKS
ncbi:MULTISPECIES: hypothetical protein [unclassified Cryobacterium]|uniref:hypothetical protein n=1 Tax=unclassified Cryobacterium TaxID=2649013 RepID=UPI001069D023|nr:MULTISPECIES: hypothetical protein [unclassified Cryobacterium]TFC54535.1 hypothetical protein E3O68_09335 [Cryobacterium sp. TMB3-1-2]TFC70883.1 hypothetical protein E3T21_09295 [Cryobacterium sp. TMB3-15]TFC77336.1 hypothetical protein E3T22_06415 [Cryobacterium sp. TMB3-10]TFD45270.1 hypothetical protein E3T58_03040 [Cryobacterium sp. TMB3-12]